MVTPVLSKTEQQAILALVREMPPLEWLQDCDTADRQQHWALSRSLCDLLHRCLKAYFSGDSTALADLPDGLRSLGEKWRDDYLALYTLILDGWEAIKAAATHDDLPIPETAGETLIFIIELETASFFLEAFPELGANGYKSFSPQQAYKFRNEGRRLQRILANPRHKLNRKDRRDIEKHNRELRRKIKDDSWNHYRDYFVMACCKACKGKSDRLYQKITHYNRVHSEFGDWLYKDAHPRKGAKGWAWSNGQLLEGVKGGYS